MMVVWKAALDSVYQEVSMPIYSRVLCAQLQGDRICLWFYCNPDEPTEKRYFRIVGTGHHLPVEHGELSYIGTVQDKELVWHVFESGR